MQGGDLGADSTAPAADEATGEEWDVDLDLDEDDASGGQGGAGVANGVGGGEGEGDEVGGGWGEDDDLDLGDDDLDFGDGESACRQFYFLFRERGKVCVDDDARLRKIRSRKCNDSCMR